MLVVGIKWGFNNHFTPTGVSASSSDTASVSTLALSGFLTMVALELLGADFHMPLKACAPGIPLLLGEEESSACVASVWQTAEVSMGACT